MNPHHFISFSEKFNWIRSEISNLNFFLTPWLKDCHMKEMTYNCLLIKEKKTLTQKSRKTMLNSPGRSRMIGSLFFWYTYICKAGEYVYLYMYTNHMIYRHISNSFFSDWVVWVSIILMIIKSAECMMRWLWWLKMVVVVFDGKYYDLIPAQIMDPPSIACCYSSFTFKLFPLIVAWLKWMFPCVHFPGLLPAVQDHLIPHHHCFLFLLCLFVCFWPEHQSVLGWNYEAVSKGGK